MVQIFSNNPLLFSTSAADPVSCFRLSLFSMLDISVKSVNWTSLWDVEESKRSKKKEDGSICEGGGCVGLMDQGKKPAQGKEMESNGWVMQQSMAPPPPPISLKEAQTHLLSLLTDLSAFHLLRCDQTVSIYGPAKPQLPENIAAFQLCWYFFFFFLQRARPVLTAVIHKAILHL